MKKLFSLALAFLMCFSFSITSFAAPSSIAVDSGMNSEEISTSSSEIQPRGVTPVYQQTLVFWPSIEGHFTLNETRNLKLMCKSTDDCTIMFYKGDSVLPFKTIDISGGGTTQTIDIKDNCSAGEYSFLLITDRESGNCTSIVWVLASEYT